MICSECKLFASEILSEVSAHNDCCQHFTASGAISVSRTKRPSSVGKPRIGVHTRHAFKASKAVCPHKWDPFPCQGHQGFRQFRLVLNKSAVVPDKADKLSDSFNFIRRQLRGVTCQSRVANNMSQENDLRLHERTLLGLEL